MRVCRWVVVAWEVLRALGSMVVIEISLRTSDLPTTCWRLRMGCDLDSLTPPVGVLAALPRRNQPAVLAALAVASRWPAGDTCLRRCLLIGHRLCRLRPVLRIGVKRDANGGFLVHSWLEFDGKTLDPTAFEFAPLSSSGR
ncbi:MAG: lasso peptide biosynthesis B2 protein [Pseudonocardiaceae bacterium]